MQCTYQMTRNPLLRNTQSIYLYFLAWAVLIASHTFMLNHFFEIQIGLAFVDSLIYDGTFAAMSVSLWYTIRYLNVDDQPLRSVLLNHLIVAVVFLIAWINTGDLIWSILEFNDSAYVSLQERALPLRLFGGVFYYSFLVVIYYLHLYYVSYKQKQIQEAELKSLVKETELSLLKSQLNPHFIFNSLNSISSLTMSNPERAQEMVVKLSSYIRYALKEDKNGLVSFREELENSRLYLEIEKVRFGERLHFEEHCPDSCQDVQIPNMLLQPLLENAIKHGVYESLEPVKVNVHCALEGHILHVTISNTFDPNGRTQKGNGIGLRNVSERLFLLFGVRDLMQVLEVGNIFKVEVFVPQSSTQTGLPN